MCYNVLVACEQAECPQANVLVGFDIHSAIIKLVFQNFPFIKLPSDISLTSNLKAL